MLISDASEGDGGVQGGVGARAAILKPETYNFHRQQ
jgi:hypothetical protein